MNYSKNLRKSAMAKRVLILLGVAFGIGLAVGGVSVYAMKTHITAKDKEKSIERTLERDNTETLVYGAYDDRTFTQEISLDWGAGDLDFTPLDCKMPEEQQEFTYYLCTGYNIDFTLVMALIQNESSFDPAVISKTNDYGYMQINQINHQWLTDTLGVTDFTDPYQNIRAGVFVLRKLFERYQDTNMVLMAYNMGEDAARLWEKGIYSTDYTEKILNYQTLDNKKFVVDHLLSTKREGMEDLIDYMEQIGFFEAPCSGGNHLACQFGLVHHSRNVMMAAENIGYALLGKVKYEEIRDSVIIAAALHDLGKCGDFGKQMYVPNILKSGKASEAKPFKRNPALLPLDHATRSIKLATLFIDLTEEEEFAIRYHDGLYESANYGVKGNETALYLILHYADLWSSRITEGSTDESGDE